MSSQKQIDANRRNAQKSTGPITEAGRAVTKLNALKHGMTADTAVLPYEDHVAWAQMREALIDHYAPANIAEEMLVELVINSYWRLLRARRVETATLRLGIHALKQRNGLNPAPSTNDDDALAVFFTDENDNTRNQERYHGNIERSYFRAVETLRKVQNDRLREERRQAKEAGSSTIQTANGFVSRGAARTVVVPEVDDTYAPTVRVWLHPEDENQLTDPRGSEFDSSTGAEREAVS